MSLLTIDDRAGSKELFAPLSKMIDGERWVTHPKPALVLGRLPYGDIAFDGQGPDGVTLSIGMEHKDISDLLQCMETRRLTDHQLPGMVNTYNVAYLVIEGEWSSDEHGNLNLSAWQTRSARGWSYEAVANFLSSISERPAVRVWQARDRRDSCRFILGRYKSWQKPYDDHTSHLPLTGVDLFGGAVSLRQPMLVWRVAGQLPRIGGKKLADVVRRFPTTRQLVLAGPEAWKGLKGLADDSIRRIQAALDGAE